MFDSSIDYLLTSIRQWELNFSVETTWSKESWIECICSICRHDNFYQGSANCYRPNRLRQVFGQQEVRGYLTFTLTDWSKPSICVSSSIRILWTSRSAPVFGRDNHLFKGAL